MNGSLIEQCYKLLLQPPKPQNILINVAGGERWAPENTTAMMKGKQQFVH